jgi:hypothetical protein
MVIQAAAGLSVVTGIRRACATACGDEGDFAGKAGRVAMSGFTCAKPAGNDQGQDLLISLKWQANGKNMQGRSR